MEKCKTCANGYPSVSCANCGSGYKNYIDSRNESMEVGSLTKEQYRTLWIDLVKKCKAQQQEIDRLKHHIDNHIRWNEEHVKARVEKEERIKALTADKDEQIEQMKYLLRRTLPILEVTNDQQELIDAINALIGGKEDE